MANLKEKAKTFWKENKKLILCGVACGVASMITGGLLYQKGLMDGTYLTFHNTIDWFDKEFPDQSNCRKLYDTYRELHPEKISYRKI